MPRADKGLTHQAQSLKVASQDGLLQAESFSGMLPHPEFMERYETLHSGLTDRMMRQFELESQHRREIEFQVLQVRTAERTREAGYRARGQWIAMTLVLVSLGGATWCASLQQVAVAIAMATTSVAAIVGSFVLGKRKGSAPEPAPPSPEK